MTAIVIAADDFAQSAAIDNGILQLVQMRRVTAFSCLTLSPRWPEAAQSITPHIRQAADIGLHLDFTQYPQPLKHSLGALIIKTKLRLLNELTIRQAIQRQLDAFEQAMGSPPDYIDGHQHVHQLPQIRKVLVQELLARYPHQLPWLRIANPPMQDGFKGHIIRGLGARALDQLAKLNGIRSSPILMGVYGFNLEASNYLAKLERWVESACNMIEPAVLMCHPATSQTSHAVADDAIYQARLQEFEALASHQFDALIARQRLALSRGSAILTL